LICIEREGSQSSERRLGRSGSNRALRWLSAIVSRSVGSAFAGGPVTGFRFQLPARAAISRGAGELFAPAPRICRAAGFLIQLGQDRRKFSDPPDEIGRCCELDDKLAAAQINEGREHFNYL
jgi:hypothetical protein